MIFIKLFIFVACVVFGTLFVYMKLNKPVLKLEENKWWGPGEPQKEDETIRAFAINVSKEIIDDLYTRLNNTFPLQPPLEGVNQHYGMNTKLLQQWVDYWKTKYNWSDRQKFLNQYPHFQTKIQGLNIHFLHAKPVNVPKGVEILPIMIIHGWVGSFREFYEMIPSLITPQEGRDFVFEVVVPSLPGFGFSDGASKVGMGPIHISQIFNKLMKRLGIERFYLQGGDWGSMISHAMAVLYPENIMGLHRNWCLTSMFHWKIIVGTIAPSLFFTEKEIDKIFPLSKLVDFLINESGYFHIQSTKPDTIGVALRDSPVGLAAYLLEKFITLTNPQWKNLPDGGLTRKFNMDQLLDDIMIYWITKSITTSMRIYSEHSIRENLGIELLKMVVHVPTGCNRFSNEFIYSTETLIRELNSNLIHLTDFDDGGHFPALEMPEVLGKDIIQFVQKVRNLELDDLVVRNEL